jgi:regulatory protein
MNAPRPSNAEALQKLIKYCSYQERCHNEVRTKLIGLKVYGEDLENIMLRLIELGFLNEERYAKTYAGGKFRQLGWGRNRIISHLKFKNVSPYCIAEAMKEIDEEDYIASIKKQSEKRMRQLKSDPRKIYKTIQYLISRGFESDLVKKLLSLEE